MVIPEALQKEILHKLHGGHQGIIRGGLASHNNLKILFNIVQNVPENTDQTKSHSCHPLFQTTHGNKWLHIYIFQLKSSEYIVIVDYFSRYPVVHDNTKPTIKSYKQPSINFLQVVRQFVKFVKICTSQRQPFIQYISV